MFGEFLVPKKVLKEPLLSILQSLSGKKLAVNHPITILDQILSYVPMIQISPKVKLRLEDKT